MKKIFKALGILSFILLVTGSFAYYQRAELFRWFLDLPEFESEYSASKVTVSMRDGVKLETHIFTPEGDGPWPVVLMRDPYSNGQMMCKTFARYNYACVHQDVRGRFGSEGKWYPLINERNDGLDTLDWLVKQSFQNGNIATYGGSYLGAVQWTMIDDMPEQVKTVIADVSHGDWYDISQRNGHFIQGVASAWALGLHGSKVTLNEFSAHKPVVDANGKYLNGKKQWLHDYLTNEDKTGDYWGGEFYSSVRSAHQQASMPVLMLGGWHDFFIDGQFEVFEELPRRDESLLVIRNGAHGANTYKDFGFSILTAIQWLDRHLTGEDHETLPVSGYLLQDNLDSSRRHANQWPDAKTNKTLFLDRMVSAKACDGGVLQVNTPDSFQAVSYIYNPENPVPSLGGSNNFETGVVDQGSDICSRDDVLSFESEVFEQSATISGAMQVALKVSSDAKDSAFTVKVQEKLADGRVLNIRDDITSLSFRNGYQFRQTYEPNTVVDVNFNLTPIEWTLQSGSSIRLDISSSNYPYFNAHPNTDKLWSTSSDRKQAEQTLLSGSIFLPFR